MEVPEPRSTPAVPNRKGFLRHWKLVIGLAVLFAMGMATGAIGTVIVIIRIVTQPETAQHWVDARMAELDRRLKLTPEQKQKIQPIADKTGAHIRDIASQSFAQIVETADEARGEIAKELTPEQRQEFEKMRPQVIFRLRELVQRQLSVKENGRTLPDGAEKPPTSEKPGSAETPK